MNMIMVYLPLLCSGTYLWSIPLFQQYASLSQEFAHISLGNFPTAVEPLPNNVHGKLYVKHDDCSGILFGGNKVRKLEFLLADAQKKGFQKILTYGAAGSNHALATTIYAGLLGMQTYCMLTPQAPSRIVQRNLLLQHFYRAHLHYYDTIAERQAGVEAKKDHCLKKYGLELYTIPVGGSNELGALGFVNAAFELKEQIDQGLIPEPDYIYLPLGSRGTAAGLAVGLKAAGLKSHIIAVCVSPVKAPNEFQQQFLDYMRRINLLLHEAAPEFTLYNPEEYAITIRHDYCGPRYGVTTTQIDNAIEDLHAHTTMRLDETYAGKAWAALYYDILQGVLTNKAVLFWNTFCAYDFGDITNTIDYHRLPAGLHPYFQE